MFTRFIRPEDRRRSGGSGTGSGTEWADTEPACFRSEAFAEDLCADDAGGARQPWHLHERRPSPGGGRAAAPLAVSALLAALGRRLGAAD